MFADEGVDQNTDDRDLKRDECKRLFIEKMKNKNKHLEEMFQENETFEIVFMSKRDKLVVIKFSPIQRIPEKAWRPGPPWLEDESNP